MILINAILSKPSAHKNEILNLKNSSTPKNKKKPVHLFGNKSSSNFPLPGKMPRVCWGNEGKAQMDRCISLLICYASTLWHLGFKKNVIKLTDQMLPRKLLGLIIHRLHLLCDIECKLKQFCSPQCLLVFSTSTCILQSNPVGTRKGVCITGCRYQAG